MEFQRLSQDESVKKMLLAFNLVPVIKQFFQALHISPQDAVIISEIFIATISRVQGLNREDFQTHVMATWDSVNNLGNDVEAREEIARRHGAELLRKALESRTEEEN